MEGEDRVPLDLSNPILLFDKIVEHLGLMAAGTGSKRPTTSKKPAAVPLENPKGKAKSSTQSIEIHSVAKEKEKEREKVDEFAKAKNAAAAAEPEDVPKTDECVLLRIAPPKSVFRELSASRKEIREGKRKVDDEDNINNHKTKKVKATITTFSFIHEASQSSASTSSKAAENSASSSLSAHRADFNPMVNTDHISEAAENCASASSSAEQAPSALFFDLNLPPQEEL